MSGKRAKPSPWRFLRAAPVVVVAVVVWVLVGFFLLMPGSGTDQAHGEASEFEATVRIDTPGEANYYRNGGIMQYVLRNLLRA